MRVFDRLLRRITATRSSGWKNAEYFDPVWKHRIAQMVDLMPAGEALAVMDLGCGRMWLRDYLPQGYQYIPVDYTDRGEGTILCDFSRHEFPERRADICFVSGCLEYVADPAWFAGRIAAQAGCCVLSYCTTDYTPDIGVRQKRNWVNHLNRDSLVSLFENTGLRLQREIPQENSLFLFAREASRA